MSALATSEAPLARPKAEAAGPSNPRLFEPHGPTLEDRVIAAWDELSAAGQVTCPICSGELTRTSGCERCGSELS
jgi:hypothetical protein